VFEVAMIVKRIIKVQHSEVLHLTPLPFWAVTAMVWTMRIKEQGRHVASPAVGAETLQLILFLFRSIPDPHLFEQLVQFLAVCFLGIVSELSVID